MAQKKLKADIILGGKVSPTLRTLGTELESIGDRVNVVSEKLIELGKSSIEDYAKYQYTMMDAYNAFQATFKGSQQEFQATFDALDAQTRDWFANSRFGYEDISNAVAEAAHSNWNFDKVLSGIPVAMELAQAGCMDLSTALDMLIKNANATGTGFDDLGYFVDSWTFASNTAATNAEEMGQAMERMGAVMQYAGDPQEIMTLLAVMANYGTVGASAGTMLKTALMRLIAPTKTAQEAMAELHVTADELSEAVGDDDEVLRGVSEELAAAGFSAYDNNGNLLDTITIFENLSKALGTMDEQTRNSSLYTMFGMRGLVGAENILDFVSKSPTALRELYSSISGASGYAGEVSESMGGTLQAQLDKLQNKVDRLKIAFGEELAPQVSSVTEKFGGFIDKIALMDEDKFGVLTGSLEGMAAAGPLLITAGIGLKMMATPLGRVSVLALAAGAGIGALSAAAKNAHEAQFGTLALDMNALKDSVDGLTTDAETKLSTLTEYVDAVSTAATSYESAKTQLEQEIIFAELTGATIDETKRGQLVQYGEQIGGALIEGIQAAKGRDLGLLNIFTPDRSEMSDAQYETYSQMLDSTESYYGTLTDQAEEIGRQLGEAIASSIADGIITTDEADAVNALEEKLNAIQAQISNYQDKAAYYTELERAGHVQVGQMKEYAAYLDKKEQERLSAYDADYWTLLGTQRASTEMQLGRALTDEEWYNSAEYGLLSGQYESGRSAIQSQTDEYLNRAISRLLSGGQSADAWKLISGTSDFGAGFNWDEALGGISRGEMNQQLTTLLGDLEDYLGYGNADVMYSRAQDAQESLYNPTYGTAAGAENVQIGADTSGYDNATSEIEGEKIEKDVAITADPSQFNSTMSSLLNGAYSVGVTIRSFFSGLGGGIGGKYAEGGRADTASIFGEAGPEWAIPEEHSRRTADLLSAAAQASGFSWGELISMNGGLNAGGGRSSTLVYSPTIISQGGGDISAALHEDKERLEKWWRERSMRDEISAYA